jgi:hypothetical protein
MFRYQGRGQGRLVQISTGKRALLYESSFLDEYPIAESLIEGVPGLVFQGGSTSCVPATTQLWTTQLARNDRVIGESTQAESRKCRFISERLRQPSWQVTAFFRF